MVDLVTKQEYKIRRAKVLKKIETLRKHPVFGEGAERDIKYLLPRLPDVKQITTPGRWEKAIQELEKAEASDLYSVKGRYRMTRRIKERLNSYGLRLKTARDVIDFGAFMESVREYSLGRVYDSTKAAELYAEGKRAGEDSNEILDRYREWNSTRRKDSRSGK